MQSYKFRLGLSTFSYRMGSVLSLCAFLIGIISLKGPLKIWNTAFEQNYVNSTEHRRQLKCINGSFSLKGMESCHPWLSCLEIEKELTLTDRYLGSGAEKIVKEGSWQGHPVAVNILRHEDFFNDFQHNLNMLRLFSKEPGVHANKVVQLVGWCLIQTPVIITEMHSLGSANNVHTILKNKFPIFDTLAFRFDLCIDFVQILYILHSHSDGPRVLCDANDPEKALSQFLLSDNMFLLLNDMDALPVVNKSSGELIKCGHRELSGDFVAPEQLWPYDIKEFDDDIMQYYDEKVDIWKIPDICNYIIGTKAGASKLQLHLFDIHSKCKLEDPEKRPTVKMVLDYYRNVHSKLGWNTTFQKRNGEG